jgi:SAM-dependent methyltransferase
MRNILMRTFGRPQGILGRLGGIIMARTNAGCGAWVTDLLDVGPNDNVLEVGFGPGVVIQRLSKRASAGHVAGIDPSREMVEQARARNTTAIQRGCDFRSACQSPQLLLDGGAVAPLPPPLSPNVSTYRRRQRHQLDDPVHDVERAINLLDLLHAVPNAISADEEANNGEDV